MLKNYCQETRRKDQVEDLEVDGRLIFKLIKESECVWTGFIWLRIGSSGRLLDARRWTFEVE
jgi:hypothetical protein